MCMSETERQRIRLLPQLEVVTVLSNPGKSVID
jgi:hypothetical protein